MPSLLANNNYSLLRKALRRPSYTPAPGQMFVSLLVPLLRASDG